MDPKLPVNGEILICLNPVLFHTIDYQLVFCHEYQHAVDFCKNPKIDMGKCYHCKPNERRAHRVNCGMIHPKNSEAFKDCVECGVWVSCRQACPKDTRPRNCQSWGDLGIPDPGFPFRKD